MTTVRHLVGDAVWPQDEGLKVIVHVCNDAGGWGAGFAAALSRRWPEPEQCYRWAHARYGSTLGRTQCVMVENDTWVMNAIAQHGYSAPGKPAIRYYALARALEEIASFAVHKRASVHMPRIGCGLAGGDWEQVEPIIEGELCSRGIEVNVYDLR